ncbi:hypothetical protein V0288_25005 [Pannus brasiliensis CCIBt3594]|uniref:Uncharacterized protein n=1 Tax=Pannus brasiliensis CCIBt3594 TaxID=1427578 RepID=A0AAW9QY24_9CHRO
MYTSPGDRRGIFSPAFLETNLRTLAKIKNLSLGRESGVRSQESG